MNKIYQHNVHFDFMSRAFELAKLGRNSVSPNPMVGCVLVKNGEIIGEGYHQQYGGAHAEVNAISNSITDPVDATAYVTMEPCNITGNTPPCTKLLIENGIAEVYIAMRDPNPEVNGNGIRELQEAGIMVHPEILEDEAVELNKAYIKKATTGRPFVIAKVAESSDGYLGIDSETQTQITNKDAIIDVHKLRAEVDAVLIGKQTALVDNPKLTVREVSGQNPIRVISDTYRTLPLNLEIFRDQKAETIVLCSAKLYHPNKTTYCRYLTIKEENNKLSPDHILLTLAKEGINSLMIEGGAKLLKSFFDEDLIDEVFVYTSSQSLNNANLKNPLVLNEDWELIETRQLGQDKLKISRKKKVCLQES
ncbi:MAG: bifunctional diaminohydroxyphosphoribosylaminopyrimidine deaminase/5-amino-6-(5-phosphoribosylamino)uracil reductase RibD [Candidatus Marinimicrobia bacterium]|nr:bifunctional diaminohydroxyphosphoribosylaminopyrimidine deaminase/5-amino-6-(5-phosphoribosylamino)uracil reductase RibD [Candidatus Neomarinimicrobiota bacterium]MBL7023643.1 bifunctional diaminohydroxyphosphoribosylaminopyrimidine deaminase/5-amino-6-(5-phosphoribosylamino)uracil reductase RibD [Candidatus Neomarinimicrobiota bacterium]MBL7109795.1 bifunctional diaminohydroxyphosphoribosylaminopyrimidine deaminase/5-amino-6-(5-phosphoribosylamino)uracil reductase RibD [Candidatus Neomarinim